MRLGSDTEYLEHCHTAAVEVLEHHMTSLERILSDLGQLVDGTAVPLAASWIVGSQDPAAHLWSGTLCDLPSLCVRMPVLRVRSPTGKPLSMLKKTGYGGAFGSIVEYGKEFKLFCFMGLVL